MNYGNGYYGVLEANYAFAICHFVSAGLGAGAWHGKLGSLMPFLPPVLGDMALVMALFWGAMIFIGLQIINQIVNVFSGNSKMGATERGHKELGTLNAAKHLLYVLLFFALAYLYLMQPLGDSRYTGRYLLEATSLCYSTIATQVILAHMAKDAYIPAVWPYILLAIGIVNSHVKLVQAEQMAVVLLAVVLIGYLHFVICVCNQMARHLGIQILVIEHKD